MTQHQNGEFESTVWGLVRTAQDLQHESDARRALAELCQIYWFPLYAYVRRKGHKTAEAQDLTQEFFAQLLARKTIFVDRFRSRQTARRLGN